jgi:hypothetical protein
MPSTLQQTLNYLVTERAKYQSRKTKLTHKSPFWNKFIVKLIDLKAKASQALYACK